MEEIWMNGDRMIIAKGECPDPTAIPWHNPELDSCENRAGVSHKRSEESSTSTTRSSWRFTKKKDLQLLGKIYPGLSNT